MNSLTVRRSSALAAGAASIAAVRARQRIGLGAGLATASAFALPAIVAAGFGRSRRRDALVWAAQMWAYKNAFEMPADRERQLRARAHFDYPVAIDRAIGAGTPASQRLARRLRRRGHLSALDKALTLFYWTWEAEPHAVLAWIRWRRPEGFAGAAGRLAATFDATLLGYWAVPTAPPWWVSEKLGRMNGDAYVTTLAFTLVYLGEHYVGDLLAGLCLALAVNTTRRPLESAADRLLALGPSR